MATNFLNRYFKLYKSLAGSGVKLFITALLVFPVYGDNLHLLQPVKTDSPRDTMSSFMEAMNDYRLGMETDDEKKIARINDAVRTLNLEEIPFVTRKEQGREAAIYLKEVIDRVIVLDYSKIPDTLAAGKSRWRLKGTEIVITMVTSGERSGEYLFSDETVSRAREFYDKVSHVPYLAKGGQGAFYKKPVVEKYIPYWARQELFVMYTWQWIGTFLLLLSGLVFRVIIRFFLKGILKIVSRSKHAWDDQIVEAAIGPASLTAAVLYWFFGLNFMMLEGDVLAIFNIALSVLLSFALIWLAYKLTTVLAFYLTELAAKTESTLDDQLVPLLNRSLKIFVVIFGILVAAQSLGINVMSLLAGLGIGGLAFALAAKDTVANFFGSLMILFDKPFQVGDWIITGGQEGTVEEIGFRSTRIRTFYNSVISVPNSVLMNANIDNMGRREYRRFTTHLGITYDTPPEKIEAFMEGIKNIIKANPTTRKDYYHVVFHNYGPDSLLIMIYLFFRVPDWSAELVERNNVLLEIYRLADEMGIEFAFPTQTVHIHSQENSETAATAGDIAEIARDFGPGGKNSRPSGLGIFTPPSREK